jgi:uncharacterized membrane protein
MNQTRKVLILLLYITFIGLFIFLRSRRSPSCVPKDSRGRGWIQVLTSLNRHVILLLHTTHDKFEICLVARLGSVESANIGMVCVDWDDAFSFSRKTKYGTVPRHNLQ